jgi:hypothetical protein
MVTYKKLKMHGHTIISTSTGYAPILFDENPQKNSIELIKTKPIFIPRTPMLWYIHWIRS